MNASGWRTPNFLPRRNCICYPSILQSAQVIPGGVQFEGLPTIPPWNIKKRFGCAQKRKLWWAGADKKSKGDTVSTCENWSVLHGRVGSHVWIDKLIWSTSTVSDERYDEDTVKKRLHSGQTYSFSATKCTLDRRGSGLWRFKFRVCTEASTVWRVEIAGSRIPG